MNRHRLALLPRVLATALAVIVAGTSSPAKAAPASLEPASSGGLAALDRALARLSTHQRLLIIAAHPDDEDTRLLTYVARGLGGEAAYLSLRRGEGGQNLIGPELGTGLGLLRSRELLAARQVDGARQFFTRAYDFGYTRSLDETLGLWPKQVLLEDAVRVIRRFKPQILVAVFPPTSRAGHGQHQASGVVAGEAFDLAGDPGAFPELEREGLTPWKATTFFRSAFFDRATATLEVPLGGLEPFSGRSIFQISLLSRSQHRCQDMGLVLPLGDASGALSWQKGGEGPEAKDLFAGVDTRLQAIADPLDAGAFQDSVAERLGRVEELARGARSALNPVETGRTGPLLEIVGLLRAIDHDLSTSADAAARQVRDLVQEKLAIAQEAAATAAAVLADAFTDRETVVPGESFPVNSVFWNAGENEVANLEVAVVGAAGWRATEMAPAPQQRSFFATRVSDGKVITVEVPEAGGYTVPYFLRRDRQGSLYDWSAAGDEERGQPFERAPLALAFTFEIDGVPLEIEREVVHRYRDQALGEIRRPLRAVPRLEVSVEPALVVWPIGDRQTEVLRVAVQSNVEERVSARLDVKLPPGWPATDPPLIEIDTPRGRRVVEIEIAAPQDLGGGRYEIEVAAVTADGSRFTRAYPQVDYGHIRPTPMPREARVVLSAAGIRLPRRQRLGYVRGASDRVPEFLAEIGMPIEVLSAEALADGDLNAYDAIIVGSRAYETDANLVRYNERLLDFAHQGGLLVVQYQQYQFVRGGFAPYPLSIARPHDRVTDETARVEILDPGHPVFTTPNAITDDDWRGWVQERGLYFAGTWDDAYKPLLAMSDPDDAEKRGALLVARHGDGYYVYTGLAFFRQLPAGVPGAYRLFANLLSLGQD